VRRFVQGTASGVLLAVHIVDISARLQQLQSRQGAPAYFLNNRHWEYCTRGRAQTHKLIWGTYSRVHAVSLCVYILCVWDGADVLTCANIYNIYYKCVCAREHVCV